MKFKQQLFAGRNKVFGKIEDGDNYIRILPNKDFEDPNALWYVRQDSFNLSPKYKNFGVKDASYDPHYSVSGKLHFPGGYDPNGCLFGAYGDSVYAHITETITDEKERKAWYREKFFFPRKALYFYGIKYSNYPEYDKENLRLFNLPERTFQEDFEKVVKEECGEENKITHPENSYIINMKRGIKNGFPSYSFFTKKQKSSGRLSPVEDTLTEEQISDLNEQKNIQEWFQGTYSLNHFEKQMKFLIWYDAHVWSTVKGAKSILKTQLFEDKYSALETRLVELEKLKEKEVASREVEASVEQGGDEEDLPF